MAATATSVKAATIVVTRAGRMRPEHRAHRVAELGVRFAMDSPR